MITFNRARRAAPRRAGFKLCEDEGKKIAGSEIISRVVLTVEVSIAELFSLVVGHLFDYALLLNPFQVFTLHAFYV